MRKFLPYLAIHCVLVSGGELSASDGARELARGTEIIGEWKPEQHLFVKGNVGVSGERLAELEQWLDANAPNWTVLLAANADGERFVDQEGIAHGGLDAVEYAMGRGLPRTTGFADLVDARTNERNGASLAIFLKERAFSYAGSDAQNQRMLGEAQWKGNLDRSAFRAMSNGGRIVDAVKDTVKEVDSRLTQQLALEQRARERAIVEAKQQRENAVNALREARGELEKLPAEVAEFSEGVPGGDGDLLRPDIAAMRLELDAGEARLTDGDGAAAVRIAGMVSDWVRGQRQGMAAHGEAEERFDSLEKRIAGIAPGDGDAHWGGARLVQARAELGKARTAHGRGDSSYVAFYENARQATDSAEEEIGRAKAERERRILAEREAAREAERRAARLRTTGIAGGGLLSALLAAGGVLMNRRRRPVKAEAEALLASWETGAHEKRDGLFALLDRTTVVVGSAADLSQRGYAGETLRLAKQTISDVDELFIMSSAVERVIREAREWIQPGIGGRALLNLVSGGNYHQSMRRLRDEPITFTPDEGIELIVRGDTDERLGLLGKLESYKPFALSFNELIGEFNERAERALESLDRIENAWATIHGELDGVGNALAVVEKRAATVVARSSDDGLFAVPGLSGQWLKSARDDLGEAITMAAGDPVQALADPLPRAKRKSEECLALCEALERARDASMPAMRSGAGSLAEAGHATGWVDDALRALSDEADRACLAGVGAPVAERVSALDAALVALAGRVERSYSLSVRMREKIAPSLESLAAAIETARAEIGKVLALSVERILREVGTDPDDQLAEGWRQHAAASSAINRGDVEAANGALDAVGRLIKEANTILADSRKSLFEHAGMAADRRARKEALEHSVEQNAQILSELKEDYSAEALLANANAAAAGTAEATIEKNIDRAEESMARSWRLTEEADREFREGRLLQAAATLAEADGELVRADQWIGAILAQKNRIEQTETANGLKIEQVEREAAGLREAIADDRVMEPTIAEFGRNVRELEAVRENLKASRRDPFALARELARIDGTLDAVARAVEEDIHWFEEMRRSLREAGATLDIAHQLAHRAASDDIPDSRQMLEMQEEVERLRLREAELHQRIKVPHGDWRASDVEADQVTAAASSLVGEMRGELERAEAAVAALSSARAAVRGASGWSGGYGVRISGSPGADLLHAAADLLQHGAYVECQRRAEDAARRARQAVSEAKALVARHQAEEQRQAEERRRAEQRKSASFSSSSSSSSFGGSRPSSGSGMSRSSFSSSSRSSSGMGRSGW
jgi:hypothetical protein